MTTIQYLLTRQLVEGPNQHGDAGHYWSVEELVFDKDTPLSPDNDYILLGSEISDFKSAMEYVKEPVPGDKVLVFVDVPD